MCKNYKFHLLIEGKPTTQLYKYELPFVAQIVFSTILQKNTFHQT